MSTAYFFGSPVMAKETSTSNGNLSARSSWKVRVVLVMGCLAIANMAEAVDPPPDGGYPGNNTAEGNGALSSVQINTTNNTGTENTAIGAAALFSDTSGSFNTATGIQALTSNTTGDGNTANGVAALVNNTTGTRNTATGFAALQFFKTGIGNTATGAEALSNNGSGNYNTANGYLAIGNFSTGGGGGNYNTATGYSALGGFSPITNNIGSNNTATGSNALFSNTTANNNTATGSNALFSNTTGNLNTANGVAALNANTTGIRNTACGFQALRANQTGTGNTAEGTGALSQNFGSYNTAVGYNAGAGLTTGHDNVDIQAGGVAGESNTMRIGSVKQTSTFISGIRGVTTANGNALPVVIDSAGQLGTVSSSARFKDDIASMGDASDAVLALKPVTFHYKSDKQNIPQFGLIAEDVAKVNPELVVRDDDGKIYTVRYDAVNAMLLNEFLKEHRRVDEQQTTIAQMKKQIDALTAGLRKVSDQMEVAKAASQTIATNQ